MPLHSTPFHPQRTIGFFGLGRVLTKLVLLGWLLGLSTLASSHTITIRYVIPAGTGDASSWANASGNLQAMITASAATDHLLSPYVNIIM